MLKELQPIHSKETNNPGEKWAKNNNNKLIEGIQITNKHAFKKELYFIIDLEGTNSNNN